MTLTSSELVRLSQRQLESTLWTVANTLRGPGNFKAYVFPVRFFNSCDHEHARAVEDFGDALTNGIEAKYHPFVIPDGGHWADAIEATQQTGVKVDGAPQRIQQSNTDALSGVFGDVHWANQERLPQFAVAGLEDTKLIAARKGN